MLTKQEIEAAEKAFLEWQEATGRTGLGTEGYSPDRYPFHAGYYAGVKACAPMALDTSGWPEGTPMDDPI